MKSKDEYYMSFALQEAAAAEEKDDVPVGAVIVHQGRIIARAHNQVEALSDPTAHAEIIAITQAAAFLHSKWLQGCTMYVTIEPCFMCAGALILARINTLVYGAADPKTGAFGSKININHIGLNHTLEVKSDVLKDECAFIIRKFFEKKRRSFSYN